MEPLAFNLRARYPYGSINWNKTWAGKALDGCNEQISRYSLPRDSLSGLYSDLLFVNDNIGELVIDTLGTGID